MTNDQFPMTNETAPFLGAEIQPAQRQPPAGTRNSWVRRGMLYPSLLVMEPSDQLPTQIPPLEPSREAGTRGHA